MDTPNYKQSTINGESWQRACAVSIENPLGKMPTLVFTEEKVFVVDGEVVSKTVGKLHVQFNPAVPNHLVIYNALNEEYVAARTARDTNPPVSPITGLPL